MVPLKASSGYVARCVPDKIVPRTRCPQQKVSTQWHLKELCEEEQGANVSKIDDCIVGTGRQVGSRNPPLGLLGALEDSHN